MKKSNLAFKAPEVLHPLERPCKDKLKGTHDHIHAANCGHKAYVHAGHICYEHEGHYHYTHNGHYHECAGPNAPMNASKRSSKK